MRFRQVFEVMLLCVAACRFEPAPASQIALEPDSGTSSGIISEDAGFVEGTVDAGHIIPSDSGVSIDAGVAVDAGEVFDAGVMPVDAGIAPDAGVITDPFDPNSCAGAPWEQRAALHRLGSQDSLALDAVRVQWRSRNCDIINGCDAWGPATPSSLEYLVWSGGQVTRYTVLPTDTTLVLYEDDGEAYLSIRHDTHLLQYPDENEEGIVFDFPPQKRSWPIIRAYNFSPQNQYEYRDLERYIGRNAELVATDHCARFVSVRRLGPHVVEEFVAVYRY